MIQTIESPAGERPDIKLCRTPLRERQTDGISARVRKEKLAALIRQYADLGLSPVHAERAAVADLAA